MTEDEKNKALKDLKVRVFDLSVQINQAQAESRELMQQIQALQAAPAEAVPQ